VTAVPARLSVDTELRHGYTLSQVRTLSIVAVRRDSFHQGADFDERLEVAWHAIIEHIYTSPESPHVREVIRAGWRAIGDHVDRGHRFYGRDSHDRYVRTTAGFERYWWTVARATPGPEERVTDRVALAQIWPQLRPVHREVLAALAAHDDYGRAAEALGKSRKTFTTLVGQARQAFLDLWHQGESPSRPWGTDRRLNSSGDRHSVTYRAIVSRQRRRAQRAARNDGQLPAPARRGNPPADLGISGAELVRRYQEGQSARQLAASLGRSYSVIHRRLHAEGIQLRPSGRPGRNAKSS
jgi:DNA-directed RNA polymerase specialized sigma24 family protein